MTARRAALALALACSPQATGERVADSPPEPAPEAAPACDEAPAGALALLSGGTCPWALVEDGGGLVLRPLQPGPRPIAVAPPAGCAPCRYTGAVTAAGPVLLAARPSPGSELADAAWVGAAAADEPDPVLAFAPLWLDRPVLGDSTEQGPAYALAPRVCGDALLLAVEPRLPGAGAEEPSPALARAAGFYAARGGELLRRAAPPDDPAACARVPLELP